MVGELMRSTPTLVRLIEQPKCTLVTILLEINHRVNINDLLTVRAQLAVAGKLHPHKIVYGNGTLVHMNRLPSSFRYPFTLLSEISSESIGFPFARQKILRHFM